MSDEENKPRFYITECSTSGHCCFDASVMDTTIQRIYGTENIVCECFDRDKAEMICWALNLAYPAG